jgi:hypothetical protein
MRRTKPKKLADAAGGLRSAKERHQKYHMPQSYRNNPMLSIQKKQHSKIIYFHPKQPNQKRNCFAFGFFSRKPAILTTFFKEF